MNLSFIRNFTIIAHIDHGKSTLADRFLEITGTVEKRKMKDQMLDDMELERERGITIKMRPVRMEYISAQHNGQKFVLNLIDTPGHIDFYYEVSRALKAVEGVILLIDATQGVQAQTLTTLNMARELGLKIIPVISKIDSPIAQIDNVKEEVKKLLSCEENEIILVSGKTGEGVPLLLEEIIEKVPSPKILDNIQTNDCRSLIFDFQYSNHQGIILFVRVFNGKIKRGDDLIFSSSRNRFSPNNVGYFVPEEKVSAEVSAGEIGYIVTGIKEPGIASVGDTVLNFGGKLPALAGYLEPKPVVWASFFPEGQDDFDELRQALLRLKLSDSSFSFEEEMSGLLGRGFRCGFLGMLHLEIVSERLKREFNLGLVITLPSITYFVKTKNGREVLVYSPALFPNYGDVASIMEPWVNLKIITPNQYLGAIMQILFDHEASVNSTITFGHGRNELEAEMPLRELMRNFFDELKSVRSGFASLSYELGELKPADVVKLEMMVAEEVVPAFTKIVSKQRVEEDAKKMVEKLYNSLPRQLFATKIQSVALGRIISSRTLPALKKNVTAHLYGGDITRKRKLWEKQKKGKKKLLERGKVNIPQEVFLKMIKNE